MLTFVLPRWQPPGLPVQVVGNRLCSKGGGGRSRRSCNGTASGVACRFAAPPSTPAAAFPLQQGRHEHGSGEHKQNLQQPGRRRRRPRPGGILGASERENMPEAPGVFDPSRGFAGERERDKVELVLQLKAMGRRFEWRGALKVFRRAKAAGMVLDNTIYSCIIGVVAKSGRWSEAVDLLREARDDPAGLPPNMYCFTAAVSACARGRNWRLALSLLDEMREAGVAPDHVTYGSAVSAMARAGKWRRALELLRRMEGEGLRPNVVCYGSAIDACAKGGEWERAVGLLQEMRESGVEPDRICYNTAVNACAQSGQWEAALSLLEDMRRRSKLGEGAPPPDVFTLNSVMHAMASAGECERLLSVLGEMQAEAGRVAPDVVSYNTAMGACNKVYRYYRALSVFEDMQAAGVTPDKESFSAAAEACACAARAACSNNNHNDDDGSMNVHDRNSNSNNRVDDEGRGTMGDRAMELMRMARDQGLRRPTAKAVAATLAALVGGGPWRKAVPAVEAMLTASGRRAWDDVMEFLEEAQLGGERGSRVGERELGGDGCTDGVGASRDADSDEVGRGHGAGAEMSGVRGGCLPSTAVVGDKATEVDREEGGSLLLPIVTVAAAGSAALDGREDEEKSHLNGTNGANGAICVNGHNQGGSNTRVVAVAVGESTPPPPSLPPPPPPGKDRGSNGGSYGLVSSCLRSGPRAFAGAVDARRTLERAQAGTGSGRGDGETAREISLPEAREGRRPSGDEEAGRKRHQRQQRPRPRAGGAVAPTSARKRGGASSALAATAVDQAP